MKDTAETIRQLDGVVATALNRVLGPLSWGQLRTMEFHQEFVVEGGLLPSGGKMFIYAPPGVGKTYLGLQLSACLSLGTPFLEIFQIPKPKRVLYLGAENSLAELEDRLKKLHEGFSTLPDDDLFVHVAFDLNLDEPKGYGKLERWVTELKIDVVIIDPLYQFTQADETSLHENLPLRRNLDCLIRSRGVSVVIIHHSTKASFSQSGHQYSRGMDEMRGAGWTAWADTILKLEGSSDNPDKHLVFDKLRHAPPRDKISLHFSGQRGFFEVTSLSPEDKIASVIKQSGGSMLQPILQKAVDGYPGLRNVPRTVKDMETAGKLRLRRATNDEWNKPGAKPNVVELTDD